LRYCPLPCSKMAIGGSNGASGVARDLSAKPMLDEQEDRTGDGDMCGGVGRSPSRRMVEVKQGAGDFKEVKEYSHVGDGNGEWEKEIIETPIGWRLRPCFTNFIIAFIALSVVGFVCLVVAGIGTMMSKGTDSTTAVRLRLRSPSAQPSDDDCDSAEDNLTAVTKDLCCRRLAKLCPTTATPNQFDCNAGRSSWESAWSDAKKDWCCGFSREECTKAAKKQNTMQDAVQSLPFDCGVGMDNWKKDWSAAKKRWCCDKFSRGCESPLYECDDELDKWTTEWSEMKIAWCCTNSQKGCAPGKERTESRTKATDQGFNCSAGPHNFKTAWSQEKKAWCCEHDSIGCANSAEKGCDQECWYNGWNSTCTSRIKWLETHNASQASACHWAHDTVMEECGDMCTGCSAKSFGCQPTSTPALAPLPGEPYNCNHDLENWKVIWPPGKQAWCCLMKKKGCYEELDCGDGVHSEWPDEKKRKCCKHKPDMTGCDSVSLYECDIQEREQWSAAESRWCCKIDDRFCLILTGHPETTTTLKTTSRTTTTTSPAPTSTTQTTTTTQLVTSTTQVTTTTRPETTTTELDNKTFGGPYDCIKGFASWELGWPSNKQKWCCIKTGRGCAASEE